MVIEGDCAESMGQQPNECFHAVITDPPYGIGWLGETWDKQGAARGFQRFSEGWAREALRITRPGGLLAAFASARTHHRAACGIEDAGWEIIGMLLWLRTGQSVKTRGVPGTGIRAGIAPGHDPIVLARKPTSLTCEAAARRYGTGFQFEANRFRGPQSSSDDGLMAPKDVAWDGSDEVGRILGHVATSFYCPQADIAEKDAGVTLPRVSAREYAGMYEGRNLGAKKVMERGGRARSNIHPSVKPQRLMEWLVGLLSPPGGEVLDPFAGSGTTGVAAQRLGRRFVLMEADPTFAEICRQRVGNATPALAL